MCTHFFIRETHGYVTKNHSNQKEILSLKNPPCSLGGSEESPPTCSPSPFRTEFLLGGGRRPGPRGGPVRVSPTAASELRSPGPRWPLSGLGTASSTCLRQQSGPGWRRGHAGPRASGGIADPRRPSFRRPRLRLSGGAQGSRCCQTSQLGCWREELSQGPSPSPTSQAANRLQRRLWASDQAEGRSPREMACPGRARDLLAS